MELVLLADVQNGYASNWARIANTQGVSDIHIGDRFREQGVGPGGEELEVAGVDISPVHGFSRLFFNRGATATKPEVHRLGAVFEQVGIKAAAIDPAYQPLRETINETTAVNVDAGVGQTVDLSRDNLEAAMPAPYAGPEFVPAKRGRGRPPGSRNKVKDTIEMPIGF